MRFVMHIKRGWGDLPRATANRGLAFLGSLVFAFAVARLAWFSDDAAITARVIANTLAGHGPNFNVTERVQAFTHPLWYLMTGALSAATGDIVLSMIALGILCAALAMFVLLVGRHPLTQLILVAAALGSFVLVEYGSSGLENPLAWLLIATMWRSARSGRPLATSASVGLLILTRLDLVLVAGPFLAAWLLRRRTRPSMYLRSAVTAVAPALIWGIFAWIYYGSPLPETAAAKLNTAIPRLEVLARGLYYSLDFVATDPIAVVLVVAGTAAAVVKRTTFESGLLAISGVGLYALYIVWIGGDFMTGRFWAVPVIASIPALGDALDGLLERSSLVPRIAGTAALVLVATMVIPPLSLGVPPPVLRDPLDPALRGNVDPRAHSGIIDEWTYYLTRGRGVVQWMVGHPDATAVSEARSALRRWDHDVRVDRIRVRCGGVGLRAITSGPAVHWVVPCGLADPFLSRIRFSAEGGDWRSGHLNRTIPDGYFEALATGDPEPLPFVFQPLFEDVSVPRRRDGAWADRVGLP